jgi:hypothetical protein
VRTKRVWAHCYFPRCENVAAARYGMFCAAEHKNLPKSQKQFYRQRAERARGSVAARRARKR